ncbi:MAG: pyridoxamine 5'-phosphate oxidase family protein [Pseudomonadota bacterium]
MNTDSALFHTGELQAHVLAGTGTPGAAIRDYMPEQHRQFFALLRFMFLATTDVDGWPVASVVTGPQGFLSTPDQSHLQITASAHWQNTSRPLFVPDKKIGMLGIDFSTRRRNRANGIIKATDHAGMSIAVDQSFGNCPKYIQSRDVHDAANVPSSLIAQDFTELNDDARRIISKADTFFVATTSAQDEVNAGGTDISHRGGMPGFIRIDGNTLTIPDFMGNRYFNTLGNMLVEPRAALLFVDFTTGDLLHLQGTTEILWQSDETARLTGAERLWRFHITRGWKKESAIPLRWTLREMAATTERTGTW